MIVTTIIDRGGSESRCVWGLWLDKTEYYIYVNLIILLSMCIHIIYVLDDKSNKLKTFFIKS
jgi:hypothetical protein